MSKLADEYLLRATIAAPFTDVVRYVLDALDADAWPAVSGWASPMERADELLPGALRDVRDALAAGGVGASVVVEHGDDVRVVVVEGDHDVGLTISAYDTESGLARRRIAAMRAILAGWPDASVPVTEGIVLRRGPGVPVPRLPVIREASYVVLARQTALDAAFDDVAACLAPGGWDVEARGDLRLLARALEAEDNTSMLAAIQAGQWEMARRARPRLTTYPLQAPRPEEEPIFRAGAPRVHAVGHDAATQTAIYSCALADDEHVQPWEIWDLGTALRDGRLPRGELVRAIRVIFSDRASAERERRPLLDLGITVQCYGATGELETVGEA